MNLFTRLITSLSVVSLLSACAAGPAPSNLSDSRWMNQQRQRTADSSDQGHNFSCIQPSRPKFLEASNFVEPNDLPGGSNILSPGDRVRVTVAGDVDVLTGIYVLTENGSIQLPQIPPIAIAGNNVLAAERAIRSHLLSAGFVRDIGSNVDVRLIENSGVAISISGAVFQPGSVRVGDRRTEDRVGQKEGLTSGDTNPGRTVSTALQVAGGVRPDAAVDTVYLIRGGKWTQLNLTGNFDGSDHSNRPVVALDRLIVPSKKCFDPLLVRPSAITAPGIRVFMSNLARSANNNAGAAIGEKTTSLPYGTRLLQGAIALNCVGGSAMNAGRKVILISRNPINGQSIVTERKVERLVRSADRDAFNPYLMPNDSLACYDSAFMNFRDALSLVTDTATPALIFGNIGK
ncbi:polysaccharide biosynthesis/export family protein [Parasphingorhabdus sp.]|uniref:polysaccharide biosynthesis/export family protein n=1 Tax=Parasphingorhabdus sp. TaxID=2709688 RepID=UPI003267CB32